MCLSKIEVGNVSNIRLWKYNSPLCANTGLCCIDAFEPLDSSEKHSICIHAHTHSPIAI